jgi:phosphoglycerate dehydrogenase-like enzyme
MKRILVESDHFLKIIPVMLDARTGEDHVRAVADFFAHDVPDFLQWCERLRAEVPGLYPAEVEFAEDQADFDAKIEDADAVVVESFRVTRATLARAKRLRAVQRYGAALSGIDVEACEERRIAVFPLRRIVNIAVAEQVLALLITLSKRIVEFNHVVTAEQLRDAGYPVRSYDRRYIGGSNYGRVPGLRTLAGSTIGIVGLGEVGREIAIRANAFGMTILYHQRNRLPPGDELALGARHVPLHELMANSDYIVVQLPLNDSTRGIIDRKALEAVKPGAILVNAARAHLVDRDAVVEALKSGRLAGLGMDVGYAEPAEPDDPLLQFDKSKVILQPHLAIAHRENGLKDMRQLALNIWNATLPVDQISLRKRTSHL